MSGHKAIILRCKKCDKVKIHGLWNFLTKEQSSLLFRRQNTWKWVEVICPKCL
jgi:hypothetical protein